LPFVPDFVVLVQWWFRLRVSFGCICNFPSLYSWI
jgi:hypothetical protein